MKDSGDVYTLLLEFIEKAFGVVGIESRFHFLDLGVQSSIAVN
jgi:hypothetical protein